MSLLFCLKEDIFIILFFPMYVYNMYDVIKIVYQYDK